MLSALCEKVIGKFKKNFWNKSLENLKGIIDLSLFIATTDLLYIV